MFRIWIRVRAKGKLRFRICDKARARARVWGRVVVWVMVKVMIRVWFRIRAKVRAVFRICVKARV
jgi:hypothetical protein